MQTFVAAFDTLFGGFRARAEATFALLQADRTAFLVVAAPEPDALREAAYFVERLGRGRDAAGRARGQPGEPGCPGLAVAGRGDGGGRPAAAAASRARRRAGLLRLHADRSRLVEREAGLRARFAAAHPAVPTVVVPALAGDVHDLDGLRHVGELLSRDLTSPAGQVPSAGDQTADGDGLLRCGRPRARPATRRSAGGAAGPGAHARSCRPTRPTRSGCPAPRRGTRSAPGMPGTPAWPCSARHPARRARPAVACRHAAEGAQSSIHMTCVPIRPGSGPSPPTTRMIPALVTVKIRGTRGTGSICPFRIVRSD